MHSIYAVSEVLLRRRRIAVMLAMPFRRASSWQAVFAASSAACGSGLSISGLLGKARRSLAESSVVQLVGVVAKHLPLTFDVVEDSNLLADPLGKPARLDGWRCDQYARRGIAWVKA
jgi:hypothetical protein